MNSFYHATASQQSALMMTVFFALLLCLYNAFAFPYKRRSAWVHGLNTGLFGLLFALEALMGHAFWCMKNGTEYRQLLHLPMGALWGISGLSALLLITFNGMLRRAGKRGLHQSAVKQAMDTLPSAVCFFAPDGAVKLCNLQMHRLFRSLTQSDLQSLSELKRALADCDRHSGIIRLSGEGQTYLFPEGKAWHYAEKQVTTQDGMPYTEAVFTDVTAQYADSCKLKKQTKRLEMIAEDLRLLTYSVRLAAVEQEVLSAKTTLHDQMGAGVLAVRRILQSGKTAEATYAVELFQRAVRTIQSEKASPEAQGDLAAFLHDAQTIGVKVLVTGEMPLQAAVRHAFILAMHECLTNGVRHADANEISIALSQSEDAAILRITNNGTVPKGPIVAKGGLKNVENTIGSLKGRMEIQSAPAFALTAIIPIAKEGL